MSAPPASVHSDGRGRCWCAAACNVFTFRGIAMSRPRTHRSLIAFVCCWFTVVPSGWAVAPATEPSADEQQAILKQLSPLMRELDRAAQMNELSTNSIKEKAPDLIAKAHKAVELAKQLAAIDPAAENFAQHVTRRFTAELAALGDKQ